MFSVEKERALTVDKYPISNLGNNPQTGNYTRPQPFEKQHSPIVQLKKRIQINIFYISFHRRYTIGKGSHKKGIDPKSLANSNNWKLQFQNSMKLSSSLKFHKIIGQR